MIASNAKTARKALGEQLEIIRKLGHDIEGVAREEVAGRRARAQEWLWGFASSCGVSAARYYVSEVAKRTQERCGDSLEEYAEQLRKEESGFHHKDDSDLAYLMDFQSSPFVPRTATKWRRLGIQGNLQIPDDPSALGYGDPTKLYIAGDPDSKEWGDAERIFLASFIQSAGGCKTRLPMEMVFENLRDHGFLALWSKLFPDNNGGAESLMIPTTEFLSDKLHQAFQYLEKNADAKPTAIFQAAVIVGGTPEHAADIAHWIVSCLTSEEGTWQKFQADVREASGSQSDWCPEHLKSDLLNYISDPFKVVEYDTWETDDSVQNPRLQSKFGDALSEGVNGSRAGTRLAGQLHHVLHSECYKSIQSSYQTCTLGDMPVSRSVELKNAASLFLLRTCTDIVVRQLLGFHHAVASQSLLRTMMDTMRQPLHWDANLEKSRGNDGILDTNRRLAFVWSHMGYGRYLTFIPGSQVLPSIEAACDAQNTSIQLPSKLPVESFKVRSGVVQHYLHAITDNAFESFKGIRLHEVRETMLQYGEDTIQTTKQVLSTMECIPTCLVDIWQGTGLFLTGDTLHYGEVSKTRQTNGEDALHAYISAGTDVAPDRTNFAKNEICEAACVRTHAHLAELLTEPHNLKYMVNLPKDRKQLPPLVEKLIGWGDSDGFLSGYLADLRTRCQRLQDASQRMSSSTAKLQGQKRRWGASHGAGAAKRSTRKQK